MPEQYKHCIVCGKSFRYTHESRKFCSETCYHEHNKKAGRIKELEKELKQKDAEIDYLNNLVADKVAEKDAEIERLKGRLTEEYTQYSELESGYWNEQQLNNDHRDTILEQKDRIAELEAVVQELAENAADYYMVSVKDAIKLATERVKEKRL